MPEKLNLDLNRGLCWRCKNFEFRPGSDHSGACHEHDLLVVDADERDQCDDFGDIAWRPK